jgi:ABC-2 type transport system ATP-binding protein
MRSETSSGGMSEQALSVVAAVAPVPGEPVVSCRGLTKRYGELVAVDGVSFSLRAGTVTGYLGPNGAGKTTTLRLLLGLAEPTSGEARVFGRR